MCPVSNELPKFKPTPKMAILLSKQSLVHRKVYLSENLYIFLQTLPLVSINNFEVNSMSHYVRQKNPN